MGTGPADAGANDRDLHRFLLRGIRAATRRSRRTVSSTTDRVPSLDRPGIASVALASDGAGGLLYGERLTGRVRRVSSAGRLEPQPVVHVTVATGGQRGLLGVSTDPTRRIFVAYTGTGPGRPIEVAQVVPAFRLVWAGPESSALANGGHLVYDTRRQQLIIGIGHLGQRAKVSEPNSPNGKLLLLHPDGAPTQHPTVLSEG